MLTKKWGLAVLIFGVVLSAGLFADDIMNTYFPGDELNTRLGRYIRNVSNLIPDSTSLQNVYSYSPSGGGWFGIGVSGSLTFYDQKDVSKLVDNASSFIGSNDLMSFPESIPYLPGLAVDLRGGVGPIDAGICGMWIDDAILDDYVGGFLGEGNHFSYRMFGADARYTLVRDGGSFFGLVESSLMPSLSLSGGYYFTWVGFGISAGETEKVNAQFRNDTIFFSLQVGKDFPSNDLPFISPFVGMKLIFSKTDSEFDWRTERPVMFRGKPYEDGLEYKSGIREGDFYTYFQVYGGVGISLIFPHLITIGGAYNTSTEHFGIDVSVRIIL